MTNFADPSSPGLLLCKSLLDAPAASADASLETGHGNIHIPRPLGQRLCLPIQLVSDVSTGIVSLLSGISPSAVRRLIISVGVDPIDAVLGRWPLAHILVEGREIMPSVADGYPSPAVVRETLDVRVATAIKHSNPQSVFRQLGQAMSGCSGRCPLNLKASAGLAIACSKSLASWRPFVAAVTHALPEMDRAAAILFDVGVAGDRPSAKTLTSKVNKLVHSFLVKAARVCRVRQGFTSKAVSGATLAGPFTYTLITAEI